tara:strand:+ start:383 stop:622 length:240 start_codon:yes stop_codon:yes gene_type:complete
MSKAKELLEILGEGKDVNRKFQLQMVITNSGSAGAVGQLEVVEPNTAPLAFTDDMPTRILQKEYQKILSLVIKEVKKIK